jgi:hypothetical protein
MVDQKKSFYFLFFNSLLLIYLLWDEVEVNWGYEEGFAFCIPLFNMAVHSVTEYIGFHFYSVCSWTIFCYVKECLCPSIT